MTDWRLPEHRRRVFLDFYEFHLRYRAHPGGVYYLMPYLRSRLDWSDEEALWYAFLNGNTQHPITSLALHEISPTPDNAADMIAYFESHYEDLEFDTDRRYQKKALRDSVDGYLSMIGDRTQKEFWDSAATGGFSSVWAYATMIPGFGRLSAFSYSEYLRIMEIDFDCDTLFLDDRSGSRSHRNGLCIVSGLDSLDWHKSNPDFDGHYSASILNDLDATARDLLTAMKTRSVGKPWERDVSLFTLESALCTYKSWHRPNRRYPNVYNDMLFDRIRKSETRRPASIFWDARRDCLPDHLRLEDSPTDPGLSPVKQNHYRLTGEVIMMSREYPEYGNEFERRVADGSFGVRCD